MDELRFEAWTRALASRLHRRRVWLGALWAVAGGALAARLARVGGWPETAAQEPSGGGCRKPGKPCDEDQPCCSGRCQGGKCDNCRGGTTACNGTCADLDSDPLNCGRCGRRCPNVGACVAGFCVIAIGRGGTGNGQFDVPRGVAVAGDGSLYVADTFNHRIQKFAANGDFVATWGGQGSGNGQFDAPTGVAVDAEGDVYVADAGNDRVQKFKGTGAFLKQWGTEGTDLGQFRDPHGMAVAANGTVYVADSANSRIQRFRPA